MKKFIYLSLMLVAVYAVSAHAGLFEEGKEPAEPIPMTLSELAEFDGKDGQPTYVAVGGKVYDLSNCWYWKLGIHVESPEEGFAGRDLTELLNRSTHGMKRVKRYPYVAYIVEEDIKKGTAEELPLLKE